MILWSRRIALTVSLAGLLNIQNQILSVYLFHLIFKPIYYIYLSY